MELLIDGHNLIHALPGIDLADPDDEARLVERLRAYCGRTRRHATVIFDRGLPGGPSRELSSGQVKVIFAPLHTTADRLIISRIEQVSNRGQYLVVSSDRTIRMAAMARGLQTMTSQEFAEKLQITLHPPAAAPIDEDTRDIYVDDPDELEDWLRLFTPPDAE
ncbi:MAG: hypothetical protein HPY64_03285 [Anaerolineae bacterium]|nr:hypothetical protein [Anaerolineae bacterium]